jgi:hypothetical protein
VICYNLIYINPIRDIVMSNAKKIGISGLFLGLFVATTAICAIPGINATPTAPTVPNTPEQQNQIQPVQPVQPVQ